MAVAVNRDLTVQVLADANVVKLMDSKQALRAAVQKGEPKCLGVSQLMLGLLVMGYSIPLHLTEHTEVVWMGVPWWSGLSFVIAGVVSILLDKYCNMNHLYACLVTSVITTVIAIMAIIVYSVDIERNPATPCIKQMYDNCDDKHYATKLSKGVKSALLLFTLAQTTISGVLSFLLFRQRRSFQIYNPLNQDAISTQAVVSADGN
ncbi:transmembrane protein 176 [Periophthalmus magnuspinnatus]|uniref:transmembrane protein 176 n=1 Tax=Periophthalmus magnuspinnatus TaxID=409849 RepID=UPI00145BFEA2|nr:transmembrane protein 176 [Periophthalmus magnuspinnatus]